MKYENKTIDFEVKLAAPADQKINYQAILYGNDGTHIHSTVVNSDGYFSLPVSTDQLKNAQLFIAPFDERLAKHATPSMQSLQSGNAYQPVLPKTISNEGVNRLSSVPSEIYRFWPICDCRITGEVWNYCDGSYVPVSNARVHISEVSSFIIWLEKLPDNYFDVVRQEINKVYVAGPVHVGPGDPVEKRALTQVTASNAVSRNASVNSNIANASFETDALSTHKISDIHIANLNSPSVELSRNYLIQNIQIFYPWFCLIRPIWWWWYSVQEIAVVTTDVNGLFDHDVWYFCFAQHPSFYFWVEYNINGIWTTVYHPYFPCGTYWNYQCGNKVNIYLDNPDIPCPARSTLTGNKVAVLTIGNNINVNQINSNTLDPNFGLIQRPLGIDGVSTVWAPFGGSLEPRVDFGDVLANAGYLYKWSYSLHGANSWTPLMDSVVRHYRHETMFTLSYPAYPLGPVNSQYFHIRPLLTPDGNTDWVVVDSRADTASAYFNTNGFGILAGMYDLKFELFHSDFSPVDFTAEGIELFVPDATQNAPFGNATVNMVNAPSHNLLMSGSHIVGFIMTVRVDNNITTASIQETVDLTNGHSAGTCGMIQLTSGSSGLNNDQIDISYIAKHPNNFAVFDFTIYKGSAGAEHQAEGAVNNSPAINVWDKIGGTPEGYSYNPGTSEFTTIKPAYKLLDGCLEAAFSEVLNVHATATDGYQSLTGYDRSDVKAFALKN